MIATVIPLRALPLAVCLIWLACEARFSPSYFADNVRYSAAEIMEGLRLPTTAATATTTARIAPSRWETAAIGADGR